MHVQVGPWSLFIQKKILHPKIQMQVGPHHYLIQKKILKNAVWYAKFGIPSHTSNAMQDMKYLSETISYVN